MSLTADTVITAPDFEHVPVELRSLRQWVLWRRKPKKDKPNEHTKMPCQVNGQEADTTDKSTWNSFEKVHEAYCNGRFDGAGFVFTAGDGLIGVDLDACLDDEGKLAEWAADIVDLLDSYTEYSPSGRGLHILCKSNEPKTAWEPGEIPACKKDMGGNGQALEMYDTARYFAVTGRPYGELKPVQERTGAARMLYSRYLKKTKAENKHSDERNGYRFADKLTDDELLEKARNAKNSAKFKRLYDAGNWQGLYASQSNADEALLRMLAYWTNCDRERMRLFFGQSALGQREKWTLREATYQNPSIDAAIEYQRTQGNNDDFDELPAKGIDNLSVSWLRSVSELLKNMRPPRWLIRDWIPENAEIMLFGASGTGKSFVAIDMALSVACPMVNDWHGYDVKHGPVVYLAGEGHEGVTRRVAGWLLHKGIKSPEDVPMFVTSCAVALDGSEIDTVVAKIKELDIPEPKMIIVDTLNRHMTGDENAAQDAALFLSACARLQQEFSCTVLLVHHTGVSQDAQDRARGSSAWRGAMDVEIQLSKGSEGAFSIQQTKNKDGKPQKPLYFERQDVELPGLIDEFGRETFTAVIEKVEPSIELQKPLSSTERKIQCYKNTYIEAALEHPVLKANGDFYGLRLEDWRPEFYRTATQDTTSGKRGAFSKVRKELVENGLLKITETKDGDVYIPLGGGAEWPELCIRRVFEEMRRDLGAFHIPDISANPDGAATDEEASGINTGGESIF